VKRMSWKYNEILALSNNSYKLKFSVYKVT